jgi:hypothetical protein
VLGSRLLGREALANPDLKEYLMAATPPTGLSIFWSARPGMHYKPLGLNSVNPAWRTTCSHTVMGVNFVSSELHDGRADAGGFGGLLGGFDSVVPGHWDLCERGGSVSAEIS